MHGNEQIADGINGINDKRGQSPLTPLNHNLDSVLSTNFFRNYKTPAGSRGLVATGGGWDFNLPIVLVRVFSAKRSSLLRFFEQ